MKQMKAIQFKEYGPPEVLQVVELPMPTLKPGYVLVQVKAAGVNFADTARRYGRYLAETPLPYVPGAEVAGIVTEVSPEVKNFKVGDRVVALTENGCYAEYVALHEKQLIPIPERVSFEQAAALLVQGLSAYHILKTSGRMSEGESVLVHAAAGGVGTLAVQLAKLFGAGNVIATASSPDKLDLARSLGADYGINYEEDNWVEQVMEITGGKGVDVILEMVGGQIFKKSLKCLSPFGRLVIYGRASGMETKFDPALLMQRSTSVVGFWLVDIMRNSALYRQSVAELLQFINEGKLKVIVGEVLPLTEAKKAHELLEGRQTKGKVVLLP
jgi:NADPH2:quinone reductase